MFCGGEGIPLSKLLIYFEILKLYEGLLVEDPIPLVTKLRIFFIYRKTLFVVKYFLIVMLFYSS